MPVGPQLDSIADLVHRNAVAIGPMPVSSADFNMSVEDVNVLKPVLYMCEYV